MELCHVIDDFAQVGLIAIRLDYLQLMLDITYEIDEIAVFIYTQGIEALNSYS